MEWGGQNREHNVEKAQEMAEASNSLRDLASVRRERGDHKLAEESDIRAEQIETVKGLAIDMEQASYALNMSDIRRIQEIIEQAKNKSEREAKEGPVFMPIGLDWKQK